MPVAPQPPTLRMTPADANFPYESDDSWRAKAGLGITKFLPLPVGVWEAADLYAAEQGPGPPLRPFWARVAVGSI